MKKITLLLFVLVQLSVSAQFSMGYKHYVSAQSSIGLDLKGIAKKKISSKITEGSKVEIVGIDLYNGTGLSAPNAVAVLVNGETSTMSYNQLKNIDIVPANSKEFWSNQALKHSTYANLWKEGFQYDLRRNLEEDAIEFLNHAYNNNLIFDDSFLESYLYSLTYKIYPASIADGRPGILNVKILKDLTPNAFIFSNGSMFVTTGLLSAINSEEELIGVLAHEIAHFVLDHAVININKAIQRKKNAEAWAAFATTLAAATETYFMFKSDGYYNPKFETSLTYNTAKIAQSIANAVTERMGLKFSRTQEIEADECAVELMKFISVNPLAFSSALQKIKRYCILNGDYLSLSGEGTHPALDERIERVGQPIAFEDKNYDRKISFVNTFNSVEELNNQHFVSSIKLANRNIDADVATEDDYLLVAAATMNMFDNEQKNLEALNFINKAKSLNVYPSINLWKQEAIALICLKRLSDAKASLLKYKEALETEKLNNDKVIGTKRWDILNKYFSKEYEWTVKMINKVDKL